MSAGGLTGEDNIFTLGRRERKGTLYSFCLECCLLKRLRLNITACEFFAWMLWRKSTDEVCGCVRGYLGEALSDAGFEMRSSQVELKALVAVAFWAAFGLLQAFIAAGEAACGTSVYISFLK